MNVRKFVQKLGKGGLFIVAAIALLIFWARWIPFDKSWQKPAHVIQNFLVPAQKGDYSQAKIFFAEKDLINIAAWEGSFETWCAKYAKYSEFKIGPAGRGKAGNYWIEIYGKTNTGDLVFVERVYAKQSDGIWKLKYGLSYEAWQALHEDDVTNNLAPHTNVTHQGHQPTNETGRTLPDLDIIQH